MKTLSLLFAFGLLNFFVSESNDVELNKSYDNDIISIPKDGSDCTTSVDGCFNLYVIGKKGVSPTCPKGNCFGISFGLEDNILEFKADMYTHKGELIGSTHAFSKSISQNIKENKSVELSYNEHYGEVMVTIYRKYKGGKEFKTTFPLLVVKSEEI